MQIQLVDTSILYTQVNCGGQTTIPTPPTPLALNVIMRPRPVFSNGFETVGQMLRAGIDDASITDATVGDGTFNKFIHHATGGRENGGWIETVAQTSHFNAAVYHLAQRWGEPAQRQYSVFCAFNLRGQTIPTNVVDARGPSYSVGINILAFGASATAKNFGADLGNNGGFFSFQAASMLTLSPNRTLFVQTTIAQYNELFVVPADGWWGIEFQCGHKLSSNTRSGFALVRYYDDTTPVEGIPAITQIGVNMPNTNITALAIGSAVCTPGIDSDMPGFANAGLSGIGIDDFVPAGPYGTEQRYLHKIYVAQTVPIGDGDQVNSTTQYDSTRISTAPAIPVTEGQLVIHGDPIRWKNIDGRNNIRTFNDVADIVPRDPGQGHNDSIADDVSYGFVSEFTGTWVDGDSIGDAPPHGVGPLIPPYSANWDYEHRYDPTKEPIRNTFHDEFVDLYRFNTLRDGIIQLEGIMPFYRGGTRIVTGKTFFFGVGGGYGDFFSFAELHAAVIPADGFDQYRRVSKFVLKDSLGTVEIGNYVASTGVRYNATDPITDVLFISSSNGLWVTIPGWQYAPFSFLTEHPISAVSFRDLPPVTVSNFQFGMKGTFDNFDAHGGISSRWHQHDAVELGLDYVYRKAIPNFTVNPINPVRAFITTSIGATPFHVLTATDFSDDWFTPYGTTIISRTIDWGDGSGTQVVAFNTPTTHTYTPGIYNVSVTVVDSGGFVDVYNVNALHMYKPAVAAFTLSSTGGNEIDCTDASVANDESITGRHYDFGDGNTSTATNPSHTYAAPGSYTVTLVLTTNISLAGTITVSSIATVPFVGAVPGVVAGCNASAILLANTVNVQGDDYNGGNPPFPAYVNTADYASWYFTGANQRNAYNFANASFNDGVNFSRDAVNTFHGHPTIKMAWGNPSGVHNQDVEGAGWFCLPSNDASPVETLISYSKVWLRVRFFGQPGIMSDPFVGSGPASECFFGQGILEVDNDGGGEYSLTTRGNALYLDNIGNGSGGTCVIDPGLPDSLILGAGYVDVAMLYDGSVANQIRTAFWIESACNLAGKNPKIDHTFTTTATVAQQSINVALSSFSFAGLYYFQPYMTSQGPLKFVWLADWDAVPFATSGNPYGVSGV